MPCCSKHIWLSFFCGAQKEIISSLFMLLFSIQSKWMVTKKGSKNCTNFSSVALKSHSHLCIHWNMLCQDMSLQVWHHCFQKPLVSRPQIYRQTKTVYSAINVFFILWRRENQKNGHISKDGHISPQYWKEKLRWRMLVLYIKNFYFEVFFLHN